MVVGPTELTSCTSAYLWQNTGRGILLLSCALDIDDVLPKSQRVKLMRCPGSASILHGHLQYLGGTSLVEHVYGGTCLGGTSLVEHV